MNLIVTFPNGFLKEKKVVIHTSQKDAGAYGKEVYGYGNFVVRKYSVWRKSGVAKFIQRKLQILANLQRFQSK